MSLSAFGVASAWSLTCFLAFFLFFRFVAYRESSFIFFNPQDYAKANPEKTLPEYSKTANFDPFISQYTGMAKVMIGLAAASISFGGLDAKYPNVLTAKMLLAYSIAFALLFSITVINFYENYLHDLKSYTPSKIALVEASGVTAMVCFALGYGYWAWHL